MKKAIVYDTAVIKFRSSIEHTYIHENVCIDNDAYVIDYTSEHQEPAIALTTDISLLDQYCDYFLYSLSLVKFVEPIPRLNNVSPQYRKSILAFLSNEDGAAYVHLYYNGVTIVDVPIRITNQLTISLTSFPATHSITTTSDDYFVVEAVVIRLP